MKIHDIENLSAAELKSRRHELKAGLASASHDELAGRYLQARTDASMRDEKLAEQGRTITTLNDAADAADGRITVLESEVSTLKTRLCESADRGAKLVEKCRDLEGRLAKANKLAAKE